jgi:multiple sugar transport system ATP-binding protein
MASIRLENITKRYGATTAIDNLDLEIRDGEFFCVLGAPGAGKTTLLRLIVGLEIPDQGNIRIADKLVNTVHPSRRDISMIFQNLALYPDKTVFDNIASPLRQRKVDAATIKLKVVEVARQLKIDWMLKRLPSQLSGGERQRVAIGRAIVRQPEAFLMDEPLANLDALLRMEMRVSLKNLQSDLKKTFVYVTHDQVEALSMGDRIAVLHEGVLQQVGDPETIYRYPNQMSVATLLGNPPMNFFHCLLEEKKDTLRIQYPGFTITSDNQSVQKVLQSETNGKGVIVGIRPEDLKIHLTKPDDRSAVATEIFVTEPLGNETIVAVKLGDTVFKVIDEPDFEGKPKQAIWIELNTSKLHLFHHESNKCLYNSSAGHDFQITAQ